MKRVFALVFAFVTLQGVPVTALCQGIDPLRTLLTEAVSYNSLESEGVPSFRATAEYEVSDYLGQPSDQGSMTLSFLRPGVRKFEVTPNSSAHPQSQNADELLASEFMRGLLVDLLLHPVASETLLQDSKLKEKDLTFGQVSLRCISLERAKDSSGFVGMPSEMDCLASNKPMVRMLWMEYGFEVVFNNFVSFAGRTFAKEVAIQEHGKVRARLSAKDFTLAPALNEADFGPADARAGTLRGDAKKLQSAPKPKIKKQVSPDFPTEARANRKNGLVYLRAVIRTDGSVGSVGVISAPSKSFAEASRQSIRQWKFWPTLSNGTPTEVQLTAQINFETF